MGKKNNERLGLSFFGLKTEGCLDPIMRIYPIRLFEEKKGGKRTFFLTDTYYTIEEFNQELDLFKDDLENIRKEAKRKFDEFNEGRGDRLNEKQQ